METNFENSSGILSKEPWNHCSSQDNAFLAEILTRYMLNTSREYCDISLDNVRAVTS
jgi:hypothetical protein